MSCPVQFIIKKTNLTLNFLVIFIKWQLWLMSLENKKGTL